jgi:hypothetical protein
MENRVEGPTSVFITTTDPDTDPETKSRFFVTSIDEGREQTRAILAFQRQRQTLDGLNGNMAADAILKRHRNFQRLLQPVAVVNPFARKARLRRRPAAGPPRPAQIPEPDQGRCLPTADAQGDAPDDSATAPPFRMCW